jgi:hypothetical protein
MGKGGAAASANQLPEEFLLVHVILEGFAAVDKNHRNFIVELAAELEVGVDVYLLPDEPSTAGEFSETFLHHFAKVASLAGIDDDVTGIWHAWRILARATAGFPEVKGGNSHNNVMVFLWASNAIGTVESTHAGAR